MANGEEIIDAEPEAIEGPSTEITKVLQEGDPESQLRFLESKAKLALRFKEAVQTILVSQTYAQDWKEFDGIKCLSSAGAERVARLFNIKFYETKCRKEDFTDDNGKAYRYIFEGKAAMNDRIIFAQGVYSTRERFLGVVNKQYRPIEDINENHIRNAAYHIYIGNGVKGLLGLRGMPVAEWEKIFSKTGQSTEGTTKVTHASGSQGGVSEKERDHQTELEMIIRDFAEGNTCVVHDREKNTYTVEFADADMSVEQLMETSLVALSEFKGEKGWFGRKKVSELRGKDGSDKWLNSTLDRARKLKAGGGQ